MLERTPRYFVYCGARRVHYRRLGEGPPLLLLHQSPRSSAEYEDLISQWSRYFTIIAPDTPGNGFSAPLWEGCEPWPDMDDIARATFELLDVLGIERCLIYGCHTGSAIAMAMALQQPTRVALAVLDGFAILHEAEREDFLAHYLPPLEPEWSGAFLTWLWARHREQVTFFPWYKTENAARMIYDMSANDKLNAQIADIICAGDYYRHSYRAAFAFDKASKLTDLAAQMRIMAAPPDPLFAHLDRLPPVPANCQVIRAADKQALLDEALSMFQAVALLPPPPPPQPFAPQAVLRQSYSQNGVHYYAAAGPTVMMLHDLWQSATCLTNEMKAVCAAGYGVLAPDLPGHGLSQASKSWTIEDVSDTLISANWPDIPKLIVSYGQSGALGAAVARAYNCPHIACDAIPVRPEEQDTLKTQFPPDLTQTLYGGHLLEAWRFCRGQHLFWPWFKEQAANIIPINAGIDPKSVFEQFRALMMAAPNMRELYAASLTQAPAADRLILPNWVSAHPEVDRTKIKDAVFYDATSQEKRQTVLAAEIAQLVN